MKTNFSQSSDGQNISKGIFLTLLSIVVFSVQDVAMKILVTDFPATQVVMIRYWGVALFVLAWIMREGTVRSAWKSKRPFLQIFRGALLAIEVWLFSTALQLMPLSDLQAIFMLFPIVTTLFAIPILKEQVGIYRWMAIGVGFLGAMIIIRPGFQQVNVGVWYQLVVVVLFALYTVLTRLTSRHDSTHTSMLYMALSGVAVSTGLGLFHLVPMDIKGWLLIGFVIVTANLAHLLFTMAYKTAPASALQPFNFLILPAAIITTIIFFDHWIDGISFFGACMTVGAGLFVWWREQINKHKNEQAENKKGQAQQRTEIR